MADLKRTRNGLKVAIAALLLVDTAAVAALLTPFAGREQLRHQEMNRLWVELKGREAAPWRGLDKKVPEARKDIQQFYNDRFPGGYSAISGDLDRLASETGVKMTSAKFDQKDSDVTGLQRVEINADVSGDYQQLVRFINSLERSRIFFIVDDIALGGQQSGIVKLQIKVETYLRTA